VSSLLQVNAWTGHGLGATGAVGDLAREWAIRATDSFQPQPGMAASPEPPDDRDWDDPRVGWGLILPDSPEIGSADKARALDADPAVGRLLGARPGSPVFRYDPDLGVDYLWRDRPDGERRRQATSGGRIGTADGSLPKYLLIVGSPEQVPWRLQYVLNGTNYVGRLDLPSEGLAHYVDALVGDWPGSGTARDHVVTWAVDWGEQDITWLMRHAVAEPLKRSYDSLDGLVVTGLHGGDAGRDLLVDAITEHRPAVVVTTSHGATLVDLPVPETRAHLGQLVDRDGLEVSGSSLGGDLPGTYGAIWYAHACCSAGADESSVYADVVDPDGDIQRVLTGVAKVGSTCAPLPTALLGSARPLKAFVGHVEPTFNWTLRDPGNGQLLTSDLQQALCDGLYRARGEPIGLAMARHFDSLSGFWSRWHSARGKAILRKAGARELALSLRLMALDRQSTVILGDPTVTIAQEPR
jgi:hypothetical protein